MEDGGFPENGIEWNDLFTEEFDSSVAEAVSNPSPDGSVSDWVAEIENMLFKDDEDVNFEPSEPMLDCFFSDILVDSSIICDDLGSSEHLLENFFSEAATVDAAAADKSPNVLDGSAPVSSEEEEKVSDGPEVNSNDNDEENDNNNDADDPISKRRTRYESAPVSSEEEEKVSDGPEVNNNDDDDENNNNNDADDPISKKRRRQLRNRDAAVRSRERKKMYVKDLEMKSRYLEGECRRLGRLLQCVLAENQTLHFSLQKGNALGASSAKQESAVLLMESLLLGSLLWFLGIMCLFTLPPLTLSNLESVLLVHVKEKEPGNLAQRGAGSNNFILSGVKSRRCKASRTKMKLFFHAVRA